jgi:hypothetical protein
MERLETKTDDDLCRMCMSSTENELRKYGMALCGVEKFHEG